MDIDDVTRMKLVMLEKAFRAAVRELPSELRTRLVVAFFDGDTIQARRELPSDGGGSWVDIGALLGKKGEDVDVDTAVERALDALWPEADGSTRRTMRLVASMAGRFGGLF